MTLTEVDEWGKTLSLWLLKAKYDSKSIPVYCTPDDVYGSEWGGSGEIEPAIKCDNCGTIAELEKSYFIDATKLCEKCHKKTPRPSNLDDLFYSDNK